MSDAIRQELNLLGLAPELYYQMEKDMQIIPNPATCAPTPHRRP